MAELEYSMTTETVDKIRAVVDSVFDAESVATGKPGEAAVRFVGRFRVPAK